VVCGDRLILGLKTGVSARRVTDGSEIWNAKISVDGPLATSDDVVIVPEQQDLHALSAATGAVVWTKRTGRITAPPLLTGDTLVLAAGEMLRLLRVADGEEIWARDVGVVKQRPAVLGPRLYAAASDGRLLAFDLASGKPIWEHDVGAEPSEPLPYARRVFVGSSTGHFCSLRDDNGQEDWCFSFGAAIVFAPAADDSHVYFVALDNLLRALNRASGSMNWRKDLRYRPSNGPVLLRGMVAAPGVASRMVAFKAATGAPAGQLALDRMLTAPPVFLMPSGNDPARLAVLTGDLNNQWALTLVGPAPPALPDIAVTPLTVLPGTAVPLGSARSVRPAPRPRAAGRPLQSARVLAPRMTAA
jgi:outer membrane protein assembly factor BamB